MPRITSTTIAEHRQTISGRLLDAFGSLLTEHGYERLALRDVAERAEVARTAIYNYYRDKPGLLLAWMQREVAHFDEALRSALTGRDEPADRLHLFVVTLLAEFASRPISTGTNLAAALPPGQREEFRNQIDPVRTILIDILAAGHAAGTFQVNEIGSTADLILACLETQRVPLAHGQAPDRAAEQVLPFIIRGLGLS